MRIMLEEEGRWIGEHQDETDVWTYVITKIDGGFRYFSEPMSDRGEAFDYLGTDMFAGMRQAMDYEARDKDRG